MYEKALDLTGKDLISQGPMAAPATWQNRVLLREKVQAWGSSKAPDRLRTDDIGLLSPRKGSARLEQKAVTTDHRFSDHHIALPTIMINWLRQLQW